MTVCPAVFVNAVVEEVWSVLSDPTHYDAWWNARTEAVDPEGAATPGQTIRASSRAFCLRWPIATVVEAVEPDGHRLRLHTTLPLGLALRNTISCSVVGPEMTRVQFG
ncbi:MAG TPA: SRPBCC family protein [Vicinamibacteria bacterium]|nr:SRPBCC family protein [Vicinamibacteria bacterium]